MATRADIRTQIQRELRDPNGNSWSDVELNDLINSGINAVSDLSPREVREDITYTFPQTIAAGAFGKIKEITPVTTFQTVFRVDLLDANSVLVDELPANTGGSSSGWEYWNGKVMLPEMYYYRSTTVRGVFTSGVFTPTVAPAAGSEYEQIKVRIFGYARHPLLNDDVTATTMDEQEQQACRVYAVSEALSRLMTDRANFQQWQIASGSSDMTISELAVLSNAARMRWGMERGRLRKMRRIA